MPDHKKMIASHYDDAAPDYDAHYAGAEYKTEDREVAELLMATLRLPLPVLDIGSGTGLVIEMTGVGPISYYGVDLSRKMVNVARAKFPSHRFRVEDAEKLLPRIKARTFGTVVATFGVWSYLDDPRRMAAEIRRLLMPGGAFLVMAYGPPEDRPTLRADGEWMGYTPDEMLSHFDDVKLRATATTLVNASIVYGTRGGQG